MDLSSAVPFRTIGCLHTHNVGDSEVGACTTAQLDADSPMTNRYATSPDIILLSRSHVKRAASRRVAADGDVMMPRTMLASPDMTHDTRYAPY